MFPREYVTLSGTYIVISPFFSLQENEDLKGVEAAKGTRGQAEASARAWVGADSDLSHSRTAPHSLRSAQARGPHSPRATRLRAVSGSQAGSQPTTQVWLEEVPNSAPVRGAGPQEVQGSSTRGHWRAFQKTPSRGSGPPFLLKLPPLLGVLGPRLGHLYLLALRVLAFDSQSSSHPNPAIHLSQSLYYMSLPLTCLLCFVPFPLHLSLTSTRL